MLRGWCSAYVGQPHTCTAHARRDWVRALRIFGYMGLENALVALDLRVGNGVLWRDHGGSRARCEWRRSKV